MFLLAANLTRKQREKKNVSQGADFNAFALICNCSSGDRREHTRALERSQAARAIFFIVAADFRNMRLARARTCI